MPPTLLSELWSHRQGLVCGDWLPSVVYILLYCRKVERLKEVPGAETVQWFFLLHIFLGLFQFQIGYVVGTTWLMFGVCPEAL